MPYVITKSAPDDPPTYEEPRPVAVVRRLSDVKAEPVRWLWPGRIAAGKLTVLAGHPGLGKSFLTVDLAARVTTGAAWPDGSGDAPAGSVLMLNVEDEAADTIRPRLEAAGGDPSRVVILDGVKDADGPERGFTLSDASSLGDAVDELKDCRLVVIDPISAYMGRTDSHKDADVRGVLAPLQVLAARRGVAVVVVAHLNKGGGGGAMSRVTGSGAFVAAARAAWAVSADPDADDDPDSKSRRLLLPLKNNIAPDAGGLAFRVISLTTDPRGPARVDWERGAVTADASAVLSAEFRQHRGAESARRGGCADWLLNFLDDAGGPVPARDVIDAGIAAGFTEEKVKKARYRLKLRTEKPGVEDGWVWYPPGDGPARCLEGAEDTPSPGPGTLGTLTASSPDEARPRRYKIRKTRPPAG